MVSDIVIIIVTALSDNPLHLLAPPLSHLLISLQPYNGPPDRRQVWIRRVATQGWASQPATGATAELFQPQTYLHHRHPLPH